MLLSCESYTGENSKKYGKDCPGREGGAKKMSEGRVYKIKEKKS